MSGSEQPNPYTTVSKLERGRKSYNSTSDYCDISNHFVLPMCRTGVGNQTRTPRKALLPPGFPMENQAMLRTIFFLGIALIVGGMVLGLVFGIAMVVLAIAIKVLIVGAIAYGIIRIISPNTAAMLRSQVQRRSFDRY